MKHNSNMKSLIYVLHVASWVVVTVTALEKEMAVKPIGQYTLTNAKGRVEDLTKSCSKPGSLFYLTFNFDGNYGHVYTKFLIYGVHSKDVHLVLGKECDTTFMPISDAFYSVEGVCPMESVEKGSKAMIKVINFSKFMTICKVDMQPDNVVLHTSDDDTGPYTFMKNGFGKEHKDSTTSSLKPLDIFKINFEHYPRQQPGVTTRRPIRIHNSTHNVGEMEDSLKMNEKKIPEVSHATDETRASSRQQMPPILKD